MCSAHEECQFNAKEYKVKEKNNISQNDIGIFVWDSFIIEDEILLRTKKNKFGESLFQQKVF